MASSKYLFSAQIVPVLVLTSVRYRRMMRNRDPRGDKTMLARGGQG